MLTRLFFGIYSGVKHLKNKMPSLDSFVWIDCEMTGLNVEKDTLLEVACVITTTDINLIDKGINVIIHQPDEVLQSMNSWSIVQHAKTGLTMESRESKVTLSEADKQLTDYIKAHTSNNGFRYLAGSSVYMDKIFIEKYLPGTNSLLHYRLLDISCLKILCSHWYPIEFSKLPPKKNSHRSFEDIYESIRDLKELQKAIFKLP